MKRIIKKILRIILVLMVIISLMTACTYKAYAASAAGVVVAGGSIGTGGAAAGLLGLMGPVTAILGIALASYGIYAVLDSSAEEEGKTKTEFIYEKVTEYNEQRNLSNEAMQDLILEGATILKNGAISISHAASSYIKGFINYMFSSNEIVNPDSITGVPSSATFGDFTLPVIANNQHFFLCDGKEDVYFNNLGNTLCAGFQIDAQYGYQYIYFITELPYPIVLNGDYYKGLSVTRIPGIEGLYYTDRIRGTGCPFPNISSKYSSLTEFFNSASDGLIFNTSSTSSSLVGDESVFNDRAGTLSPSADENTVFTPPLVDGLSGAGAGTISISDYLDAINDLLNEGETDIPIADPVTDVVTSVAVTDVDLTDTIPTVDPVEEQDNIGATVVIDPDLPIKPDTNTINSLAFDLSEIFPFCIPFDLYNLLSKFVAEPEAPHWEISIPLPMNLPALEFEIDLSGFESVGVVLRSFEMVLFVASLAVATRSIYLRG